MTTSTTQVYPYNFIEETKIIQEKLVLYPNICIDTEFKRFRRVISHDTSETEMYEDLIYNVSYKNLRQVGITICDDVGNIGGTWRFDMLPSKKAGIEKDSCIHVLDFASELERIMDDFRGRVNWITFSGYFDIALLIALVTKQVLPTSIGLFVQLVAKKFGRVYDLKVIAKGYNEFGNNKFLGLQRLADMLGIKRIGNEHDAASDSLVTAAIYAKFVAFNLISKSDEGFLYLLPKHICYAPSTVEINYDQILLERHSQLFM